MRSLLVVILLVFSCTSLDAKRKGHNSSEKHSAFPSESRGHEEPSYHDYANPPYKNPTTKIQDITPPAGGGRARDRLNDMRRKTELKASGANGETRGLLKGLVPGDRKKMPDLPKPTITSGLKIDPTSSL